MANDRITAQSWTHRMYVPNQNRFVHSGQVLFLENLQRTPETTLVPIGDDYPSSDKVIEDTKRRFPSGQLDSFVHEPRRRRSARLRGENILKADLLSSESFLEAQAQRIVHLSLSKNCSLIPHLIAPTIFSLSADEEPLSILDDTNGS